MASNGYATIAGFIALDPDKETYIFRRFDILTARNLLNLQGELVALQDELDELDADAAISQDPDVQVSMRSWKELKASAHDSQTQNGAKKQRRFRIAEELEVKLKKYHQALILSKEVMKLDSPDRRMVEAHRSTLKHVEQDERRRLNGAADLVALKPPADKDVLSNILRNHWPFPSMASSSHGRDNISYFPERHLVQLISALSMIIAAILIIGPILALNFTSNSNARLGIAIIFIILFATGLGLSTGVSRDNIFVATATYSAVLVVFVSGNLGNVGDPGGASGSSGNATSST